MSMAQYFSIISFNQFTMTMMREDVYPRPLSIAIFIAFLISLCVALNELTEGEENGKEENK